MADETNVFSDIFEKGSDLLSSFFDFESFKFQAELASSERRFIAAQSAAQAPIGTGSFTNPDGFPWALALVGVAVVGVGIFALKK